MLYFGPTSFHKLNKFDLGQCLDHSKYHLVVAVSCVGDSGDALSLQSMLVIMPHVRLGVSTGPRSLA